MNDMSFFALDGDFAHDNFEFFIDCLGKALKNGVTEIRIVLFHGLNN